MKKITKIWLSIATSLALFLFAFIAYATVFNSQQLAPSPANGNCLTTNGANPGVNAWSSCGSSGNSAWTIGNGLIYNATSTDSVLVGTTTPTTAKLYVQGSGTKNPLTIASSTGSTLLTVLANGNVGIGTTTPTALLVVATSTSVSPFAVTAAGNVGIGTVAPAGQLAITDGTGATNGGVINAITSNGLQIVSKAGTWFATVSDSVGISLGKTGTILGVANTGVTITGAPSGSSATSNFLNITGAMPTTMTTDSWGTFINVSGAGSSNFVQTPFRVDYTGGYTGAGTSIAGTFVNRNAGTGTTMSFSTGTSPKGNLGLNGATFGSTTGYNFGGLYFAENGSLNIGFQGNATVNKNSGTNIGVAAFGLNGGTSPIEIGGYFGLQNSAPTFASAALMADNGTEAQPIFVARDNGTEKFRIDDGGNVGIGTSTPGTTLDVNGIIRVAGGSNSAPAFVSQTGGLTTGAYFPAANQFAIATNGTKQFLINTNGQVGIGSAANPSAGVLFQMVGNGTNTDFAAYRNGGDQGINLDSNLANGLVGLYSDYLGGSEPNLHLSTYSQRTTAGGITILVGGNTGIGTTTATSTLTVVGTFQMPYATTTTISTIGQAAINTTPGTFSFHDGTAQRYLNPEHLITPFYIENPSTNELDTLWIANATTTITKILCVNKGASDSANINFVWDNSNQTSTTSAVSRIFTAYTACSATTTPSSLSITGSSTINTLQPLRFITSTASSSGLTVSVYGRDNQ